MVVQIYKRYKLALVWGWLAVKRQIFLLLPKVGHLSDLKK